MKQYVANTFLKVSISKVYWTTLTCTHVHTHAHTHAHTHTRMHTHVQAHTYTYTNTCTHAHTHTCICSVSMLAVFTVTMCLYEYRMCFYGSCHKFQKCRKVSLCVFSCTVHDILLIMKWSLDCQFLSRSYKSWIRDRPIVLIFYLLCYAAVLIKFTY